jgi:hypothetical protein
LVFGIYSNTVLIKWAEMFESTKRWLVRMNKHAHTVMKSIFLLLALYTWGGYYVTDITPKFLRDDFLKK